MGITPGWLFVIMVVSSGLPSAVSVSRFDFKVGHFQLLQQRPQLKRCAERYIQKDEYAGCRVSVQTDHCEGLPHSWGLNETMEDGYAYAKKVFVEETFQPPVSTNTQHRWEILVVLNTGSQIDISIFIPQQIFMSQDLLVLTLTDTPLDDVKHGMDQIRQLFQMRYTYQGTNTGFEMTEKEYDVPVEFALYHNSTLISDEIFKMSLLAKKNSVAVLVEDKETGALELSTHLRTMRYVNILESRIFFRIHKLKITGN